METKGGSKLESHAKYVPPLQLTVVSNVAAARLVRVRLLQASEMQSRR